MLSKLLDEPHWEGLEEYIHDRMKGKLCHVGSSRRRSDVILREVFLKERDFSLVNDFEISTLDPKEKRLYLNAKQVFRFINKDLQKIKTEITNYIELQTFARYLIEPDQVPLIEQMFLELKSVNDLRKLHKAAQCLYQASYRELSLEKFIQDLRNIISL